MQTSDDKQPDELIANDGELTIRKSNIVLRKSMLIL